MAGTDGRSPASLKRELLRDGREFSFHQVIRLLRTITPKPDDDSGVHHDDFPNLRVRPQLSLAFPSSDVASVEEYSWDGEERFRLTATFLGLYGVSSPLPTFYTSDLMNEAAEDMSVTRDFLDVFNHRFYYFLQRCWIKYRQYLQAVEYRNPEDMERLFCLIGLGEKVFRDGVDDVYSLIRYIGLLSQFPRSAAGLETLLQDIFGKIRVGVEPCILRRVKIPPDQRMHLGMNGCTLGQDVYVGEEVEDRMGKFRLNVGPLDVEQFQDLLPGNKGHAKLVSLTHFYVSDPLEFDMKLMLKESQAKPVCLGSERWARLGWDTWSFSGKEIGQVHAMFYPN